MAILQESQYTCEKSKYKGGGGALFKLSVLSINVETLEAYNLKNKLYTIKTIYQSLRSSIYEHNKIRLIPYSPFNDLRQQEIFIQP